jgi:hypothetical protein
MCGNGGVCVVAEGEFAESNWNPSEKAVIGVRADE